MCFGPFLSDVLSDLEFTQPINHQWTDNEGGEERGKAGKSSAERKIPKNTKWSEILVKLSIQKPIKQIASTQTLLISDVQPCVQIHRCRNCDEPDCSLSPSILPARVRVLRPERLS